MKVIHKFDASGLVIIDFFMIKQILVILLGVFFLLNGINHFYNNHILEEYAKKRGLIAPHFMIMISGFLLICGGISLITGILLIPGIIGLCMFLIIASFSIHQFWQETKRDIFMLELMNFVKNIAIMLELIYIATTIE